MLTVESVKGSKQLEARPTRRAFSRAIETWGAAAACLPTVRPSPWLRRLIQLHERLTRAQAVGRGSAQFPGAWEGRRTMTNCVLPLSPEFGIASHVLCPDGSRWGGEVFPLASRTVPALEIPRTKSMPRRTPREFQSRPPFSLATPYGAGMGTTGISAGGGIMGRPVHGGE